MTIIKRIFPLGFPWQTQDPFLFCVYHLDKYPRGTLEMTPDASLNGRNLGNDFTLKDGWRMYHGHTIPGFPYHPHRGFETVTIVNKGFCDHSDSLGAAGRFGEGDVQWMTAGSGVQHSEMFPLLNTEKENTLELFQIWINLPKKDKLTNPYFKMLWHEEIPVWQKPEGRVRVISGIFGGETAPDPAPKSWAAEKDNEIGIWDITINPGQELAIPGTKVGHNRSLYFYEGKEIHIEDNTITVEHGIDLQAEKDLLIENGEVETHLLLLQGKPIGEPVAKYGPFVMNTQEEIQQAMQEYRLTQFGGWPWPYPDNVHDREKGRFALYPDGKLIEK